MTPAPRPAAVDRVDRAANPGLLLVLVVCLCGAVASFLLLPGEFGVKAVSWTIAGLAIFGVFSILLYAFGQLQFASRAGRYDTTKAIADSNSDGLIVTDADSRIIYANDAYRALSGAEGAADLKLVERLFTGAPEVSEAVYRLAQAARAGRRASEELRMAPPLTGEGAAAWYRIRVRPLEGIAKSGVTLWTVADITRERERHESFFQDLQHAIDYLDHAPAGFFSAEPDGSIAHMNATLANWLDYDIAQFAAGQLKLADIVAADGAALLSVVSGRPGEVTTERFDVDLKRRQGQFLPVRLLHRVAFSSAGLPGASRTLVLNRAPGEDKGEDLRAAEVRFARFFNSTPMAIASVDLNGVVLRANGAFARLVPLALKAGPGESRPSIYRGLAERDHAALREAIAAAGEGKGDIAPLDVALEGEGARSARFFVSAADPQGDEGASAIVFALDTTEQRTLQENFVQSQKMQAIGQLAGGIAHDFNNVLTAIIGYSDLLLANHRPTDPSFQDIMQIKQNANRAAGLVRQLLAFSRRQTLRPQTLQLGEVLSELQMLLRRLVGETIELDVVHGRDLWLVKADLNQFEQVIVNLVVNARDAMSEGGHITLRTRNVAAAECAAFNEKSLVAGRIRAGRGRGHRPRHSRRGARQDLRAVLHHQGGRQGHRPRPVDGLRHRQADRRLRVLRQRAGRRRDVPHSAAAPHSRSGRRAAEEGSRQARRRSHRPRRDPARRGRGGGARLRLARARLARLHRARGRIGRRRAAGRRRAGGKIDLIVSDVIMPEMDGPTMLTELRRRGLNAKIMFVSGYADDAFAKNLPEGQEFLFLPKPFTLKQLIETVKSAMS